jgi:hypothetical protein
VTVSVRPAIVKVPVRDAVALFAATANVTMPAPRPSAPPVTVIQDAWLLADHGQSAGAVTAACPFPPSSSNDACSGEIE